MKKIVALVLAMVMVLGLATTAFAATTSTGSVATTSVTPVKAAWYTLATTPGTSMEDTGFTVTKIELTTVTGKIKNDVPMYVPNLYELNDSGIIFMEVAKANATHALKNNGAYIYLAKAGLYATGAAAVEDVAVDVVIDSKVAVTDEDVDCGDAYLSFAADGTVVPDGTTGSKKAPVAYYVSGDDVYTTNGADWAYFNGEFVAYGAAPSFKTHVWDDTTVVMRGTDAKGHDIPVSVACEDCEKTFPVVPAYMFDNTWVEDVDYQDYLTGGYFVVLKAAATDAPAADAGDKVESAETFDAGIAMYVGMSVMAAAGSAVVLKKKD